MQKKVFKPVFVIIGGLGEKKPHTRNPFVANQKHTSVVRHKDGSLGFNFKHLKKDFDPEKYPFEVFEEIRSALKANV